MDVTVTPQASRRCSYCGRCWPYHDDYTECPVCREPTDPSISQPMPADDAAHQRREAAFGWWLYDQDRL